MPFFAQLYRLPKNAGKVVKSAERAAEAAGKQAGKVAGTARGAVGAKVKGPNIPQINVKGTVPTVSVPNVPGSVSPNGIVTPAGS